MPPPIPLSVLPKTGPNQLTLRLFITAVPIQDRMRHANNDCIFFQICKCIRIKIDFKTSLFIPAFLHLVQIFCAPVNLFLLLLLTLLGAIVWNYIGFDFFFAYDHFNFEVASDVELPRFFTLLLYLFFVFGLLTLIFGALLSKYIATGLLPLNFSSPEPTYLVVCSYHLSPTSLLLHLFLLLHYSLSP